MKVMLAVMICVAPLCAQDKFRVEKIDAARADKLIKADAKLNSAVAELEKARIALEQAQSERKAVVEKLEQDAKALPYEGVCSGGSGWNSFQDFRATEIRGDYLLITQGKKQCPTSFTVLTGDGTVMLSDNNSTLIPNHQALK